MTDTTEIMEIKYAQEVNVTVRIKVLQASLIVEDRINQVLLNLFDIELSETKLFGYKSKSLSFQTKIDILKEINILTKEECSLLNLFMQFRNQFMHNIYSNSFSDVVKNLGRERQLLDFEKESPLADSKRENQENLYSHCFTILTYKILMLCYSANIKVIGNKMSEMENKILEIKNNKALAIANLEVEQLKKLNDFSQSIIKTILKTLREG